MSKEPETATPAGAISTERSLASRALLLLPNALTLCAILCGITSLQLSSEGAFALAMAAIMGAVVLDTADGYAARALGASSPIGAELDSLADFVNFGVAPAMLIYHHEVRLLGLAGWIIVGFYVLATGLRLARFNVQSRAAKSPEQKKWFCGLPSTAAAVVIVVTDAAASAVLTLDQAAVFMAAMALAAGALMVSTVRFPALFKR